MKTRNYAVLIVVSLAGGALGMDAVEFFETRRSFELVSSTETNLTLKLNLRSVSQPFTIPEFSTREHEERLVLSPDKETRIGNGYDINVYFYFDPVRFKDQRKGFRIVDRRIRAGSMTNTVVYVALGDTLTTMGSDDVEMIMETGEWKTPEEASPIKAYIPKEQREEVIEIIKEEGRRYAAFQRANGLRPPLREKPQPVPESGRPAVDEPPAEIGDPAPPKGEAPEKLAPAVEEGQPVIAGEARQSSLWAYIGALAAACVCVMVCLVWKRKTKPSA